jgi:hypothetical protein
LVRQVKAGTAKKTDLLWDKGFKGPAAFLVALIMVRQFPKANGDISLKGPAVFRESSILRATVRNKGPPKLKITVPQQV